MALEATVTSKGQITIPKEVRDHLDIEPGRRCFRFNEEGGVRVVPAPADPMDRLERAQERAATYEPDARELIERERAQWDRLQ